MQAQILWKNIWRSKTLFHLLSIQRVSCVHQKSSRVQEIKFSEVSFYEENEKARLKKLLVPVLISKIKRR
jgi:hypothetical protein